MIFAVAKPEFELWDVASSSCSQVFCGVLTEIPRQQITGKEILVFIRIKGSEGRPKGGGRRILVRVYIVFSVFTCDFVTLRCHRVSC